MDSGKLATGAPVTPGPRHPRFGGWPGIATTLQMLGCLLISAGVAPGWFDVHVIPATWRFAHYPLVLAMAGALMILLSGIVTWHRSA